MGGVEVRHSEWIDYAFAQFFDLRVEAAYVGESYGYVGGGDDFHGDVLFVGGEGEVFLTGPRMARDLGGGIFVIFRVGAFVVFFFVRAED